MIRAQTYERLDDVPDQVWVGVVPSDFFFQRAFLEVMQRSAVEQATYRYVVLLVNEEPVGFAVLSRFLVKLDLLADDEWVKRMRRWVPRLLDVPIVCCGVPASLSQHHLHVVEPELRASAVQRVHSCMDEWARETRCPMLVWKEWSPDQGIRELVCAQGYVALPTPPDHSLADLPPTVDEYIGSMRSSYRRKYKAAKALTQGPGPVWTSGALCLKESPFTADSAEDFNRGYLSLMERTEVRLETYPPAFFSGLADSTLDTRQLRLTSVENDQSLTALLIASGDVLAFALVAKDRAHYEDALYTLLLRCIALYAVQRGFTRVRMGQTSSYAKCSMGAQPRRLEIYIRMRGRLRHKALERFGTTLFPEAETPELSVFKEAA